MIVLILGLALILWLAICVYFYIAQDAIMYETGPAVPSMARASVYPGVEVRISPDDQRELTTTSWHFAAKDGMGTILFFHGNNGNIETRTGWMQFALAQGWGLMMVGYRGYGGNPGRPNQAGLTADALAAYDWLVHEAGVAADTLHIFGHSLGSAIACQVASKRPCKSLGLMSPMTHMAHVAFDKYPFLPTPWIVKDHWRSVDVINAIDCPLAITYCDRDTTVRGRRSVQLYAASTGPKERHLIPGIDHGDIALSGGPQVIVDFFARQV